MSNDLEISEKRKAMKYKVRTTCLKLRGWYSRPLLFKWGNSSLVEAEAKEDCYDSVEEAKDEVIQMRKEGDCQDLVIVGVEDGIVKSYYPDKWRL